uniref:Endonuclease/exonuclease/phosphatase domain-containing protein n=1 Tax=Lactuca sativa TaxID=4236 RepID=A0A9R1VLX0_LACSA|nr:hypothetical protein LSAT_V11C400158800 [Lactuca sativa]
MLFCQCLCSKRTSKKRSLWNNLSAIINSDGESCWFVFGDFNAVCLPEERLGSVFFHNSVYHFNNFIHSIGLLEIKMGGRRFTYMSKAGDKHSKLDRFLVSPNVVELWPNLSVTALPRVHFDHCATLLSSNQFDFGPSPFRFFKYWLKDPSFDLVLRNGWSVSKLPYSRLHISSLSVTPQNR